MEMVIGSGSFTAAGIQPSQSARIEVIGVGGGGSNAVNRMILSDLEGVGYRVLNTDAQALIQSQAQQRLQLGQTLTRGLGAGGNPTIGQKAAEESRTDLHDALQDSSIWCSLPLAWAVERGLVQHQWWPKSPVKSVLSPWAS